MATFNLRRSAANGCSLHQTYAGSLTPGVKCGATTARVSALGITGTISTLIPSPRHPSTHCCNTRASSHRIN